MTWRLTLCYLAAVELISLLTFGLLSNLWLAGLIAPIWGIVIPLFLYETWGTPRFGILLMVSILVTVSALGACLATRSRGPRSVVLGIGCLTVYAFASVLGLIALE